MQLTYGWTVHGADGITGRWTHLGIHLNCTGDVTPPLIKVDKQMVPTHTGVLVVL